MKAEIILRNLGSYLPSNVTYSESANAFLTDGYVSRIGNVYFNVIRFGNGIAVKEAVGQNHSTWLNAVYIYSLKDNKVLADRSYDYNRYSEMKVKSELRDMLNSLLKDAAEHSNLKYDRIDASNAISKMVNEMFSTDQRQMLEQQQRKLLGN
jgi:hypothetical protein